MEAPGLDFGGSGDDFFEIFNSFCDVFSKYCLQGSLQHALHETLESLSHLLFEEAENLLRTCRVAGHLPANFQPAYPHYVGPRTAKWVGGGGPPPGGSSMEFNTPFHSSIGVMASGVSFGASCCLSFCSLSLAGPLSASFLTFLSLP